MTERLSGLFYWSKDSKQKQGVGDDSRCTLECGGVYGGKGTVYIKGMGGKYKGIHQKKDFGFLIFQN